MLTVVATAVVGTSGASAKFYGEEGHWLAFERASAGQSDIVLAKPGGAGVNITQSAAVDGRPAWDQPPLDAACGTPPSHHRLAFESRAPGGNADIFLVDVAGLEALAGPALAAAPMNITNAPGADDTAPAWHPDGFRVAGGPHLGLLAFASNRDANTDGVADRDIFITDETGGRLMNVTHNDADDTNPEWSSDGRYIAFESTRGGSRQIWAVPVTVDGGHFAVGVPFQLTSGPDPKHDPTWIGHQDRFGGAGDSGADEQIVYSVDQGGRSYLDAISQDETPEFPNAFAGPGGAPTVLEQLTGDPGDDIGPAWSSGADGVVFATTAGGTTPSLQIMRGAGQQWEIQPGLVVSPGGSDSNPDWQPIINCAAPNPRMPAPAPVTRTPKPTGGGGSTGGGGGGTGGTSGNSGRPGSGGSSTPAPRLMLQRLSVRATGRGAKRRVVVRLTVNEQALAVVRLVRGRLVVRRSYRLHAGANRLVLRVPRRARAGLYRLTVRVQAHGIHTVARRVRLRR